MQNQILFKETPITFSDEGKGSAIVLLHGFLENRHMWKDVSKELIKTHRIISIDLLGHGETSCIGYVHTMELMAEAVQAVLKSLRLRKVCFVGHSMGGYVSLAFAEKYPEMIKGLCLMNSTAQADSEERKKLRLRANKMVQTNYENMVRISVANLFKKESLELFNAQVQWVKEEALKTPLQGYMACQEGMRIRLDRTSILSKVQNVLYIIGKYDPILNADKITLEAKSLGADFVVLSGGHMSHIENREELINSLLTFVKALR